MRTIEINEIIIIKGVITRQQNLTLQNITQNVALMWKQILAPNWMQMQVLIHRENFKDPYLFKTV